MRPRILVVDDDPGVTSLLKRGLSYEGYAGDVAADGQTALAMARERLPDLVILDIMMPGIDGLEVTRRLRAADDKLPIPVYQHGPGGAVVTLAFCKLQDLRGTSPNSPQRRRDRRENLKKTQRSLRLCGEISVGCNRPRKSCKLTLWCSD